MKFLIVVVAGLVLPGGAACADIRLRIEPRVSATETEKAFGPLAEYLVIVANEPVRIVVPERFAGFGKAVAARGYDLAFAAPDTTVKVATSSMPRVIGIDRNLGYSGAV